MLASFPLAMIFDLAMLSISYTVKLKDMLGRAEGSKPR
jgi:hypothetical protein